MLHRLLFVAGMTVGVMTPLVWSAYVARMASPIAPATAVEIAKAAPQPLKRAPETRKPAPAASQNITGAIAPAPPTISTPTTLQVALPPPKPSAMHTPSPIAPAPAIGIAKAAPQPLKTALETRKPAPAASQDITGAIAPAAPAISAPRTTVQIALPPPKPLAMRTLSHVAAARLREPHHARHRMAVRDRPAVVDSYNGTHIITVCAALTVNERLRAGCP